jgi:hypothetical protein
LGSFIAHWQPPLGKSPPLGWHLVGRWVLSLSPIVANNDRRFANLPLNIAAMPGEPILLLDLLFDSKRGRCAPAARPAAGGAMLKNQGRMP